MTKDDTNYTDFRTPYLIRGMCPFIIRVIKQQCF